MTFETSHADDPTVASQHDQYVTPRGRRTTAFRLSGTEAAVSIREALAEVRADG